MVQIDRAGGEKFSDRRDKNVCRGGKPKMRADIGVKFHPNYFEIFYKKFEAGGDTFLHIFSRWGTTQ